MTDEGQYGRRDEIAFRAEQLGAAKTRAEAIGHEQRQAFADIMRMLEALATDGIAIDPAQVSFADDVDQVAWKRFCTPSALRGALDPPLMETETAIALRAIQ